MGNTFFKKLLPIIEIKPLELQKSITNTRESFYNFQEFRKRPLSFSNQKRNSTPNWTRNSRTSRSSSFPIHMPPPSGYANIKLYQNPNLIPSPNKEKKLLPFFVPKPYPLPPPEPLSPPPPISKHPNISSLGLNLTKNGTTFSNVERINQPNPNRNSINNVPLPSTKLTNSPARPKSPLLIPGALKKRNRKNRKSN